MHPGEVRSLDELISSIIADDNDDEVPSSVDTFRLFIDKCTNEVDFRDKIEYAETTP